MEVEVRADGGLAVRDPDRVLELDGLVDAGPAPWSAASCGDHDGTGLGSVSVPVKPERPGSGAVWKPWARYQILVVPWPGTGCAVPRNAVVSVDISVG